MPTEPLYFQMLSPDLTEPNVRPICIRSSPWVWMDPATYCCGSQKSYILPCQCTKHGETAGNQPYFLEKTCYFFMFSDICQFWIFLCEKKKVCSPSSPEGTYNCLNFSETGTQKPRWHPIFSRGKQKLIGYKVGQYQL